MAPEKTFVRADFRLRLDIEAVDIYSYCIINILKSGK
jgi:hypothetical protein